MKKLMMGALFLTVGFSAYAMEEALMQLKSAKSEKKARKIALKYFEEMQKEQPERLERQKDARQRANELDAGIKSLGGSEEN